MRKVCFLIVLSFLVISCTEPIDYSNPKSVIEQYYVLKQNNELEKEYELLAETCKEYAGLHDYLDYYSTRESLNNEYEYSYQNFDQLPIDLSNTKYRHYEILKTSINKEGKDTIKDFVYETLFNENEQWKVIWTSNIAQAANKQMNEEKFSESIETYQEILKFDPFNGSAYQYIGWCQNRQGEIKKALASAQKAIDYNPKEESNYNLLATIYLNQKNYELALENYKKAIEMTHSDDDKVYLLSNASISYTNLFKYNEAKKVINEALSIDPMYTHAWWQKGIVYNKQSRLDSAITCYKKAITLKPMADFLQRKLYYNLADTEYRKAKYYTYNTIEKDLILTDAKKQILKALDFEPDNVYYNQLLDDINKMN